MSKPLPSDDNPGITRNNINASSIDDQDLIETNNMWGYISKRLRYFFNNNQNKNNSNNKFIICLVVGLVFLILIFVLLIIFIKIIILENKNKIITKKEENNFRFNANMSFALNINKNGSFSEHIYTAIDTIPRTQRDIVDKNNIYPLVKFYDSKQQLEVSKKTILTDEIKDNLINNSNYNTNKKYVLISYIVKKIEVTIDKSQVKIKEYYRNKFKDVEKSNSTNKKEKYKNITDQIGFYIPNELILGGRIDISFSIDKNYNISNLTLIKNNIFNSTSNEILNSFQNYDNYSCNIVGGGIKSFCEDKNLTKWYESLIDKILEIILYNNLQTIGDFLEDDIKKSFRKYFYNKTINYTDGIYHGDVKNNLKNGYGIFEYFNGYIYLGEWKDDKRHGEHGILKDKNNMIYNGDWKDDKKDGNGAYYEKGKIKYDGEWKNDLYDGKGILYFGKNDWIKAKFKKGKCKKILNNSSFKKKIKCFFDSF